VGVAGAGLHVLPQAEDNLADDTLYTKVVSRRMLQMTAQHQQTWKPMSAQTGRHLLHLPSWPAGPGERLVLRIPHPKGSVAESRRGRMRRHRPSV
jgi:hypothetical protein